MASTTTTRLNFDVSDLAVKMEHNSPNRTS
jgi:hypothetical protein